MIKFSYICIVIINPIIMSETNILGNRIKEALSLRKMSANTLSKMIGKTPVAISNVITGKSSPSADVLLDISAALNVTPNYLLGIEENKDNGTIKIVCPHCGEIVSIEHELKVSSGN